MIVKKAFGRLKPDLRLIAGPDGLRVQAKGGTHAVEYHDPDAREPADLTIPYAVLEDVQGTRDEPVRLYCPKKKVLAATWEDRSVERTMQYDGEGWGLTHDGKELIMSDGSATLRFRDPQTFAVTREIEVRDNGMPLAMLNELEYINGEIWANIWYDDRIARISPADGKVLGFVDLSTLYPKSARGSEAVLNGIAYDAAAKRLFVTGKNWPQLYEIEVARP